MLGIIIPPSISMVVLGVTSGISIGKLFMAGFIPGLGMCLMLCLVSYLISCRRGYGVVTREKISGREFLAILGDAVLPLMAPVIILGGIFGGIVTATEASVIAVVYGLLLSLYYRELTWARFKEIIISTAVSSTGILIIMAVATGFGWIMTVEKIPAMVSNVFLQYANSPVTFLLAVTVILFIMGCLTEVISLIVLLTPIFMPIAVRYGIDPIHFGMVMIVNFAVAGVTPPVGLSLMAGMRVADPSMGLEQTMPDVLYFTGVMLLMVLLVILFPHLSLFLPSLIRA
jgi:C4-dicarboxylate transporter DctM subunit